MPTTTDPASDTTDLVEAWRQAFESSTSLLDVFAELNGSALADARDEQDG